MKYLKRILALPFVIGVFAIYYIFQLGWRSVNFVKYGGEMNNYDKHINSKTIRDVYSKLFLMQEEL